MSLRCSAITAHVGSGELRSIGVLAILGLVIVRTAHATEYQFYFHMFDVVLAPARERAMSAGNEPDAKTNPLLRMQAAAAAFVPFPMRL